MLSRNNSNELIPGQFFIRGKPFEPGIAIIF